MKGPSRRRAVTEEHDPLSKTATLLLAEKARDVGGIRRTAAAASAEDDRGDEQPVLVDQTALDERAGISDVLPVATMSFPVGAFSTARAPDRGAAHEHRAPLPARVPERPRDDVLSKRMAVTCR